MICEQEEAVATKRDKRPPFFLFPPALLICFSLAGSSFAQWPPARQLDPQRLSRAGLQTVSGDHLTLVTDLPIDDEIGRLPAVFDAAVPLWGARFGVAQPDLAEWRVQAYLIGDRAKFAAAGLMPHASQDFPYGLSMGHELWLHRQDIPYYTRHLLLHEGTHSFMATRLGGCGPGWYMEGVAELLGQHAWEADSQKLALGVMLPEGHDARSLGRVGLLKQAYEAKRALSIPSVMQIDNSRTLKNGSYAWVWALSKLLDTHPRYQQRFRSLHQHVLDSDFNDRFRSLYRKDFSDLSTEWRLLIATLQYGHDISREAIDFERGNPLASTATSTIAANRGWQSTGVLVEQGKRYTIEATGRFTIAVEPDGKAIESEAGGVTIDYHAGRPLGMLLAAIDARGAAGQKVSPNAKSGFLRPAELGRANRFTAPYSGTLYLRVNDSPAELDDNAGELRVTIARESP